MAKDPVSERERQLEQLVLRLATFHYNSSHHNPHVFFNAFPDTFPIDVPLPGHTHVLCTLAHSEHYVEIFLESTLVWDEIAAFYQAQLTGRDWIEVDDSPSLLDGFDSSRMVRFPNSLTFCQGEQGPSLTVFASSQGTPADLRLRVYLHSSANPLAQRKFIQRQMPHGLRKIIPVLTPPAGSWQKMISGGIGGNAHVRSSGAVLTSDLELDVLVEHYSEQLKMAGWIQSGQGMSAPTAWHSWTYTDEDQQTWSGIFLIFKRSDTPREHLLFVTAEMDSSEGGNLFAGWLNAASNVGLAFHPN